jgi:hypothetical protein
MASREEALKAKELVKQQLGAPGWLYGVGLGGVRGDYCVKVNVTSLEEVTEPLPKMVGAVSVVVEAIGPIRRLASAR